VKSIDSQALSLINSALGLTGSGSPITELLDGQVEQALDLTQIIRRGRTLANTSGLFHGVIRHVHTDAESIATTVSPYSFGATGLISPYPDPVPPSFDLWLLYANVRRISGGGTLNALLKISEAARSQGWGIDDSGVAIVSNPGQPLAHWDAVFTEGAFTYGVLAGTGELNRYIGLRLQHRRDTDLEFLTTSSITVTYQLEVVLGLFPVSLGQDAVI